MRKTAFPVDPEMPEKTALQKWILASASPRRKEILARLGLQFRVDPSHMEEPGCRPGESPSRYVLRMARIKAAKSASKHASGMIISADTAVVSGNRLLGKPSSREDGRAMLSRLSGGWHEVWTGLCLYDCGSRRCRSSAVRSRVHFRRMSASDIEWYLDTGEYCDKAGAYAVQGHAAIFIDRIEGCYFNIVGFPVAAFEALCRKSGIDLKNQLKSFV